jgi:hypothetical protein
MTVLRGTGPAGPVNAAPVAQGAVSFPVTATMGGPPEVRSLPPLPR